MLLGGKHNMYCRKCGKKLEENEQFCSACGEPVDKTDASQVNDKRQDNTRISNIRLKGQSGGSNKLKNSMSDQPTKALIVEGIGILFFIYMLIANSSNDNATQIWLQRNGAGVFFIGLIFLVVSYFMLKKYKKSHKLYGIGYVGYLISCIAVVLMVAMLIISIFMVIPVMMN